eukprot:TRINITY_DN50590_c0_g1_i1.p1 TRINITY_DN50590_c0_g1~~TRINITY_DN50590_c0_g1_i1.p1  ORF type:complete len:280 (+),score=95.52 TRINITY_DN50590_c0_g1_i1:79-840(+)
MATQEKRRKRPRAERPAAAAGGAAGGAAGETVRVTVIDAFEGGDRSVQEVLPTTATTLELKERVAQRWSDWQADDMVFVVNSEGSPEDGQALADDALVASQGSVVSLMLFHRAQQREAFSKLREEQQRREEHDEEDWGGLEGDADAKVHISVLQTGPRETAATITWRGEEHTLGNALRHVLMRDRRVLQCGYTIPHPLEDKMQMDILATQYPPQLVREGLLNLSNICETAAERFGAAYDEFAAAERAASPQSQ